MTIAVRRLLAEHRERGDSATTGAIAQRAADALDARETRRLRRVINATGVVLHTNLGRAPLAETARAAVIDAMGYSTTEFDLRTGRRGARTSHVSELVAELCGAESATAVNNGAAALMLTIDAIARGGEVIVSRGELVEIGGAFRLPDIIVRTGARLVEVGTTNRTRPSDYEQAIGPDTRLILKVHASNFRMVGFTSDVGIDALGRLGREHGIPVALDAGSGLIVHEDDGPVGPLSEEPAVRAAIADGADLVLFSGDKLLGGPQAGLIVGRRELVDRCARSPLARALRIDKLQIAALEATLKEHLRADAPDRIPAIAMMRADEAELRSRCEALRATLGGARGIDVEVVADEAVVGGGAAPERPLPTTVVLIGATDPDHLLARLRTCDPPVIARISADRVALDLRTVPVSDDELLGGLVLDALVG